MIVIGGGERQMQARGTAAFDDLRLPIGTRAGGQVCFTHRHLS